MQRNLVHVESTTVKEKQWSITTKDGWTMTPDDLVLLNSQGMSFHRMERELGIPHSTAHSWVKKKRGNRPHNPFSLMKVLTDDYLNNRRLSRRDKEVVAAWMNRNASVLLESDGHFYSTSQEQNFAIRETSPVRCWGDDLSESMTA